MTLVPGSPEWVAERRTGVGGTDIARILGVSRFGGPMGSFLEKRGLAAPLIESSAVRWGKLLEQPVAHEYAVKTGRKVRRAAGFIRQDGRPWAFANVDRWSDKAGTARRILEVKTAGEFAAKDFGEENTDQVPPDHLLQVMWYIAVTGKDTADLAVLIGGQKHRIYTVERDDALIAGMLEVAEKFWRDTEQGIPPEIDGSEGSSLYLAHKYRDTGIERPMDDKLAQLGTLYAALKESVKAREEKITKVGNQIRDLMGDARWAEGSGVRVVYSAVKGRTTTKWAELVAARNIPPSVIEEFSSVGAPTRALTVTMKGDV